RQGADARSQRHVLRSERCRTRASRPGRRWRGCPGRSDRPTQSRPVKVLLRMEIPKHGEEHGSHSFTIASPRRTPRSPAAQWAGRSARGGLVVTAVVRPGVRLSIETEVEICTSPPEARGYPAGELPGPPPVQTGTTAMIE